MSVQTDLNNSTVPFLRFPNPGAINTTAIIAQDAGRAIPLAPLTLMAKIAASQKWVPFTDETAVDGSAIPAGIFLGSSIPSADIVAGDITDNQILVGAAFVDLNQLIIENSKTLDTVIDATGGADNINIQTVRDYLANRGIFVEDTVDISSFENA